MFISSVRGPALGVGTHQAHTQTSYLGQVYHPIGNQLVQIETRLENRFFGQNYFISIKKREFSTYTNVYLLYNNMRHISGRHKITDDEHQSWGPSWKLFYQKSQKEKLKCIFQFFENKNIFLLMDKTEIKLVDLCNLTVHEFLIQHLMLKHQ